jgi:hypothetical protein
VPTSCPMVGISVRVEDMHMSTYIGPELTRSLFTASRRTGLWTYGLTYGPTRGPISISTIKTFVCRRVPR